MNPDHGDNMLRVLSRIALGLVVLLAGLWLLIVSLTYHPETQEPAFVSCTEGAQPADASEPLKVLSYNVQYHASKNYVFFYDLPDEQGPDTKPSKLDIKLTLEEVVRIVNAEQADIVLLQEVNGGADSRTHFIDQVAALQDALQDDYPCYATADYWRNRFVPHPKILGATDMKLMTLSKYRIEQATRHQLPIMPMDPVSKRFYFKRAILETRIAMDSPQGSPRYFTAMNTHFDAWADGTGLMKKQIEKTVSVIDQAEQRGDYWALGGDFNLLPPDGGRQWQRMQQAGMGHYQQDTPIDLLYERYGAIPPKQGLLEEDPSQWFTHNPNAVEPIGPDRTIDYLFYSPQLTVIDQYVRQRDTQHISDHLPVIGIFEL